MQFQNTTLSAEMLQAIATQNFTEMTEIQAKTIPLLLEGKDVIGKSNTGTGKTAAFSIPIIEQIPKDAEPFVYALILCPTRELAMQACEEIGKFAKFKRWVKPVAVYGGASMERQIHALKNGANIVVGTPGRVLDHLRRRTLKLEHLRTIVLDEADEMLNMGFREDIESVLAQTPEDRQTVLFSATMPPAILAITKQYQKDPQMVQIQSPHRTVDAIAQYAINVPMGRKTDALHLLLASKKPVSSMVFCNTKKMVDELTEALQNRGFAAVGLHGDMKQMQRTQVMNSFKNGRCNILIATDVAARGIDVKGVDAVFNYDLPQDHEYYIHRIGRTGRAGKTGTAQIATGGVYRTSGHQVSFCGYFPADHPKYSCIVVIRRPRIGYPSGGTMSGGVVRAIAEKIYASHMSFDVRDMERDSMAVMVPRVKGGDLRAVEDVLDELDIKADTDSLETKWVVASAEQEENKVKLSDLTIREGLVPRVVGMGAKDAVFLLEQAGLRVSLSGVGRVVSQSIQPGQRVSKGQTVLLTLK